MSLNSQYDLFRQARKTRQNTSSLVEVMYTVLCNVLKVNDIHRASLLDHEDRSAFNFSGSTDVRVSDILSPPESSSSWRTYQSRNSKPNTSSVSDPCVRRLAVNNKSADTTFYSLLPVRSHGCKETTTTSFG